MRISGFIGIAILAGFVALPSCGGDDDDDPGETGGTAGKGGSGGNSGRGGTSGRGGSSGSSNAGRAGSAGDAGSPTGGGGEAGEDATGGTAGGAGTPESGGTSGEAGTPGSGGDSGSSGSSGSPGESGAGGESGGSGNPDLESTACSAFPETVTLGPTIQLEVYGAVLCEAESVKTCRLTTNTYSDGTNPCENADRIAVFTASEDARALQLASTWHINSTTAGTIDSSNDYYMTAIPLSTEITATIEAPDGDTYTLVFTFGAGREFTLTSFAAVL